MQALWWYCLSLPCVILVINFMLTLCGAEINLVTLRQHQLSVTRGQMNKRFGLNSTTQNRPDRFFKRLLEWISVVRSSVHSMGFWEVSAKSSVGSWAGTDQLILLSVLWPLKDTRPLGPRRSLLLQEIVCYKSIDKLPLNVIGFADVIPTGVLLFW